MTIIVEKTWLVQNEKRSFEILEFKMLERRDNVYHCSNNLLYFKVEIAEMTSGMPPFQSTENGVSKAGESGKKGRSKQKVTFAVQKNTHQTPPNTDTGIGVELKIMCFDKNISLEEKKRKKNSRIHYL